MINKRKLRRIIDSFYYKKTNNLKLLGHNEVWNIDVSDLNSNSIVYSGGVGKDITFELDLVKIFDCSIFLFDPTPTAHSTIRRRSPLPLKINYFNLGLNGHDANVKFRKPENIEEGSYTINFVADEQNTDEYECKSISSLFKLNNHRSIDILKIDIEGFEYAVLDDILKNSLRIKQICVEFHEFGNRKYKKLKKHFVKKLKNEGYKLIFKDMNDYTFLLDI